MNARTHGPCFCPGGGIWAEQGFSEWGARPAASASPENLVEMQVPRPHPDLLNQKADGWVISYITFVGPAASPTERTSV